MKLKTEVLIVGGGATGTGILRDLSLRKIPCLLIEKGDFLSGASGRNHGLLHSGARYVVFDPEAARECISENRILKRIAPQCIEETGGLFIYFPEDSQEYRKKFISSCNEIGIPAKTLKRDETLSLEPKLNPDILGAIEVPDGAIDPFQLVLANVNDAETHGGKFLLHTKVISILLDNDKIKRVFAQDSINGEEYSIEPSFVINATGAWADDFLKLAGIGLPMSLSKGSMLITNQRFTQRVINRLRPPSDGDIIVPNHTVSILGTTSIRVGEVENFEVTPYEVSILLREASKMIPDIDSARFIRAYAGIRPLIQTEETSNDRTLSRGFFLIDHEKRNGIKNLITITGGKLVTYRLMAEKASDLISEKMGIKVSCSTHMKPLSATKFSIIERDHLKKLGKGIMLCDCELVSQKEVESVLSHMKLRDLQDLLHRTRIAKGTCQGGFCIYRLLSLFKELELTGEDTDQILKGFLEERWNGIRPILWGIAIKEEEFIEGIYKGILNIQSSEIRNVE